MNSEGLQSPYIKPFPLNCLYFYLYLLIYFGHAQSLQNSWARAQTCAIAVIRATAGDNTRSLTARPPGNSQIAFTFISIVIFLLGPQPRHMEGPRLGVQLELQLPA